LPLYVIFATFMSGDAAHASKRKGAELVLTRMPARTAPVADVQEEIPEVLDRQIVEASPELNKDLPEPKEVTHLAAHKSRTDKERKARKRRSRNAANKGGKAQVDDASKVQSADSDSLEETTTVKATPQRSEVANQREKRPDANTGEAAADTQDVVGARGQLLMPATTAEGQKFNLQALSGDIGSSEYLPKVKDEDKWTVLNTDRYRFSDFFYRVRDAIRRHWHPRKVYTMRDPTGKLYGVKDRHTVFHVTLDPRGRLKRLVTVKHSGLDFMDHEARAAFERAQPFTNPPEGLLNPEEEIEFQFGFFFEITSGKHKFMCTRL